MNKYTIFLILFALITVVLASTSTMAAWYSFDSDYQLDQIEYYYDHVSEYNRFADYYNRPQYERYDPYTYGRTYYDYTDRPDRDYDYYYRPNRYNEHSYQYNVPTNNNHYRSNYYNNYQYDQPEYQGGYVRNPSTLTRNANFYPDRSRYQRYTYGEAYGY